MDSKESIQVLYQDTPVWLEEIKGNNVAEILLIDIKKKLEVPIHLLIENISNKIDYNSGI
jgi:hypothetical protein